MITTIANALASLYAEPFPCPMRTCNRIIPAAKVHSLDCSACPLNPPCVRKPFGEAWPGDDGDDDGDAPVGPKMPTPGVLA